MLGYFQHITRIGMWKKKFGAPSQPVREVSDERRENVAHAVVEQLCN